MDSSDQTLRFSHNWLKPILVMIVAQMINVANDIFYKLAIIDSMPTSILVAYRFIFGAISLAPFVIYNSSTNSPDITRVSVDTITDVSTYLSTHLPRKHRHRRQLRHRCSTASFMSTRRSRTKPTWKQGCLTFVYGLLAGSLYHNLCLASLTSTSTTFVSGIINVTPIITFVLGLIVRRNKKRLETLACRTSVGKIKLAGFMLSIGGVMLLALWKRIEINFPTKFSFLPQHYHKTKEHGVQILGLVLAIIAAFSNATFLTIQAKFKEDGHSIYLIPFMMNLMGAIQSVVYALCVERDWEQWKLGWNIRFWASSFVGVFSSGLSTTLIVWCISEMGPLFVSTFNPIGLILMSLVGSMLLDETLYVTSVGAIVLIIAATLLVLYGKLKEMDNEDTNNDQSEDSKSEENEAEVVNSNI